MPSSTNWTGESEMGMSYEEFLAEWRNGDVHVVCRTSGSTGLPKQIRLPKQEMERSALRTIGFFGLDRSSHLHSCISPDFIGGKMMAVRAETLGCRLSWEEPSNRPLRHYEGDRIDLLALVPSQMIDLLDRLEQGEVIPEIRHIIIGGAPLNATLRRRIWQSGLDCWETYGMTETASHIALRRASDPDRFFTPLKGINVHLADDSRLCIEIEGWKNLETNDIAETDSEGRFRIVGRADNVIITGGKKVHPEEIEAQMEAVLGCEVLVTGEPDEKWGQRVVMTVDAESRDEDASQKDFTKEEIEAACRECLPREAVPKEIRIGHIPRTANGKKFRQQTVND